MVLALLQIMLRPLFATLAATQTSVFTSSLKPQSTSIYAYIGIFAYIDLGSVFCYTSHRRSALESCSLGTVLRHLCALYRDSRVYTPVYDTACGTTQRKCMPQADLMQPAVLTQTMVELIVMIILVRILQPLREEPVTEPQNE